MRSAPAWRRKKYAEACARTELGASVMVVVRSMLRSACVEVALASDALTTLPEHAVPSAAKSAVPTAHRKWGKAPDIAFTGV